jgi:dTDP-4-dehydrorhamnose 3,5-epimerase
VNEFNFYGVKRFYQIQNFSTQTIRAWHAHKDEGKYVFVSEGSAIVAAVKLDDYDQPSKDLEPNRYILSDKSPNILFIPPGYANGFRPLEDSTSIIFFSTKSLSESHEDDFRFPANYWGNDIWEVENR